jgi:predicted metal-dependent TIM-barrel fold hydrolase
MIQQVSFKARSFVVTLQVQPQKLQSLQAGQLVQQQGNQTCATEIAMAMQLPTATKLQIDHIWKTTAHCLQKG